MALEVGYIHFEESIFHKIEVVNNETLFCARDIAVFLGFTEATESAISLFCKRSSKHVVNWKGKEASITFIPLSDVNELVIKSEALRAQAFGEWVNTEFAQIPNSRIMNELVEVPLVSTNNEMRVSTEVLAEGTGTDHASVIKLVRTYLSDLEEFGQVRFEIRAQVPRPQGGFSQPGEMALLNEDQSTLLITYMRNSEIVRGFKKRLVKAFRSLRSSAPNFKDPLAAAQAWIEEYKAKQAALQQAAALSMRVEEMRPAQELVDVIANTEGAKEINDCAKELKIDPLKLLRKWMLENEWIFEKTIKGRKHTFAYQDKASRGWLVHDRKIIATGEGIDYVMVTEKGFVELGKRYLKDNPFDHEEFRAKTTPKKRKTKKEL